MLKLESLEVNGFKTFVDPVTSRFARGITAIVGPNGCGKSNLAEAITWVLGEQSPKSLRGSSMEEVIFNGSGQRKPLGMAEVSLTFLSDGSVENAEDGRITIGRRIFRGGEGQYRLNDRVARLKDIRDILMDTGLGIRAYSVIEQGRIGMILSGKPQERRKLIEEAAGITRYKNRKRLASLKLEDATADLLRLDDIISEVERSLRSLKRQANAARRHRERRDAYRELLDAVLVLRWARLQGELEELGSALGQKADREAELLAEIARGNAKLAECRQAIDARTEEAVRSHERQATLLATIEGRQELIKGARATRTEIAERLEGGARSEETRRRELSAAEEALAVLAGRRQMFLSEREDALAKVHDDRRRIDEADAAIEDARRRHRDLLEEQAASHTGIDELKSRLVAERIVNEKAVDRRDRAGTTLERSRDALRCIDVDVKSVGANVETLDIALTTETQAAQRAAAALEASRNRRQAAQVELETRREELVEAQKRAAVLRELGQRDEELRAGIRDALLELGLSEPRFPRRRSERAGGLGRQPGPLPWTPAERRAGPRRRRCGRHRPRSRRLRPPGHAPSAGRGAEAASRPHGTRATRRSGDRRRRLDGARLARGPARLSAPRLPRLQPRGGGAPRGGQPRTSPFCAGTGSGSRPAASPCAARARRRAPWAVNASWTTSSGVPTNSRSVARPSAARSMKPPGASATPPWRVGGSSRPRPGSGNSSRSPRPDSRTSPNGAPYRPAKARRPRPSATN